MNNTFDWNRFCKVVNKDFRNMWPMFGSTMIILAALPFAVWLLLWVMGQGEYISMPPDYRLLMIEGMAYLAAIMAPSRMYRTWNIRNEGIYYAMLPASKKEKFISALLFSLVVCPLTVYLGGVALDVFLTALPFGSWHDWLWQCEMGFPFTLDMGSLLSEVATADAGAEAFQMLYFGTLYNIGCWLGYIGTVLMFFFTATLFKKHKVLQTLLWLYLINFVLSIILIPVFMLIFGATDFLEWFYHLTEAMNGQQMANWFFGISLGFDVITIALFGWLSWHRLNRMAY